MLDQPHACRQLSPGGIPSHQTAIGEPRQTFTVLEQDRVAGSFAGCPRDGHLESQRPWSVCAGRPSRRGGDREALLEPGRAVDVPLLETTAHIGHPLTDGNRLGRGHGLERLAVAPAFEAQAELEAGASRLDRDAVGGEAGAVRLGRVDGLERAVGIRLSRVAVTLDCCPDRLPGVGGETRRWRIGVGVAVYTCWLGHKGKDQQDQQHRHPPPECTGHGDLLVCWNMFAARSSWLSSTPVSRTTTPEVKPGGGVSGGGSSGGSSPGGVSGGGSSGGSSSGGVSGSASTRSKVAVTLRASVIEA